MSVGSMLSILAGGGMNETAHTGAVDNVTTRTGYLKQLVTDLRTLIAGTQIGSEFTVTKRLTKTAVTFAAAVDLTGVSTVGGVTLKRVHLQNGANVASGASTGVNILSNDTNEPLTIQLLAQGSDLAASGSVGADIGYQSAVGKKFQIQAGTSDLAGTGSITVHMTFRRDAAGSAIAAA